MPSFLGRFFAILLCRIGSIILFCSYSLKLTYFDKNLLLLKSNFHLRIWLAMCWLVLQTRAPLSVYPRFRQHAWLYVEVSMAIFYIYLCSDRPLWFGFGFAAFNTRNASPFLTIGKQMTKMTRKTKPTERKWICRREWKTTRWRQKRSREDVEKSVKPKEETQLNFY